MIAEKELVPFTASPVPIGPWLIYAPHPDDETFGMGGSIILARQQKITVTLVVVTDGALGGSGGDFLVLQRKKEVELAAKHLGIFEVIYLNQPDRHLKVDYSLVGVLANQIRELKPASVFFPSPLELHPDHRQTAQVVWNALQAAEFQGVAFSYEISIRGRVNLFVDITDVVAEKRQVMEIYQSQLQENDYPRIIEALCQSRTYTLPAHITQAEGFWAYDPEALDKDLGANTMCSLQPFWMHDYNLGKSPLVSVIIRTKNRPSLLGEAVQSVAGQTYPHIELIVINDGGEDVGAVLRNFDGLFMRINYVQHSVCRGRAAAANTGLDNAAGDYIIFLDDDDLFDAAHVADLLEKAVLNRLQVVYADVRFEGEGGEDCVFSWEYDSVALRVNNYLPIHSVLFSRTLITKGCCFDEGMEVYEDWDFWLQMASHVDFVHLKRVSATYRRLGNSQVGLSFLPEKREKARSAIFDKWRLLWSGEVLDKIFQRLEEENNRLRVLEDANVVHIKALEEGNNRLRVLEDANTVHIKALEEENNRLRVLEAGLNDDIETMKLVVHEKDVQIAKKDAMLANQVAELVVRVGTINDILSSRSWKITTPLRDVNLLANRILQKSERIKSLGTFYPLFRSQVRMHGGAVGLKKTLLFLFRPTYRREKIQLLRQGNTAYTYKEDFSDKLCAAEVNNFAHKPLISIVVPVYNVAARWLDAAVRSVEEQIYPDWELILVDDGSTNQETIHFLQGLSSDKIKVIFNKRNMGIATTTNRGIEAASGEYIGLLDNDDELTRDALFAVVKRINADNADNAEIIYSDEDFIDEDGGFSDPHFKPDFSPDLLLSHNYITHFLVFKKALFDAEVRFSSEFDGAQDYDFLLRATEKAKCVIHLPRVLYHWRKLASSTSSDPTVKPEAAENGRKAVCQALLRRNIKGHVYHANLAHYFRVKRQIIGVPLISIIIPFKDKVDFLRQCLDSIFEKSTYTNFEVIGINNNSLEEETLRFMSDYESRYERLTFYDFPAPFNYPEINNFGVGKAQGQHIVLLNNDVEVITPSWLEAMLEHSQRPEVGVVGAKLFFGNDTIQHAGIVMGIGCETGSDGTKSGIAGHSHKGFPRDSFGYFNRLNVIQNFSGVTGACLMVQKSIYEEFDGLDGENFAVSLNDVDFCLRLHLHGYLNVFTPYAELYHHESISRGYEISPEQKRRFGIEQDRFHELYDDFLKKGDSFYNPNLTLLREDFSMR